MRSTRPASPLNRFLSFVPAAAIAVGVVGAAGLAGAQPVPPASNQPLKIVVANPSKIFNEMAETKALQTRMKQEQDRFAQTVQEKAGALKQLKESRDALNPSHPQYEELNNQLMKASMEYKVWGESQKMMAEHTQKKQMKALFEKITAAIGEVAKRDGIDVVIANNSEQLPTDQELEGMDIRALRAMILQKDVLYTTDRADISTAVITLLDARYKAAGGATAAVGAAPLVNPTGSNR